MLLQRLAAGEAEVRAAAQPGGVGVRLARGRCPRTAAPPSRRGCPRAGGRRAVARVRSARRRSRAVLSARERSELHSDRTSKSAATRSASACACAIPTVVQRRVAEALGPYRLEVVVGLPMAREQQAGRLIRERIRARNGPRPVHRLHVAGGGPGGACRPLSRRSHWMPGQRGRFRPARSHRRRRSPATLPPH